MCSWSGCTAGARNVWRARYEQINLFERNLIETGTTILKFFLHISRAEQRERLLARLDQPDKYWKFNRRATWTTASGGTTTRWRTEEMLARTSTPDAPWYVVPADGNPSRRAGGGEVVAELWSGWIPKYPARPAISRLDAGSWR